MKLKSIIIIVVIIAILALIKIFFLSPDKAKNNNGASQKPPVSNVTGYIVKSQLLENRIFSSGTILANEEVVLHPEVSGKLIGIYFKEGFQVSKGTLLAKINDDDLQAQLKKLNFQLKLASEKKERLNGLLQIQGVSQQEFDESANQLQVISADIDFVKAQIAKTEIRAPFDGKIGLRQVSVGSFVFSVSTIAVIQQTNKLKIDFTVPEKYVSIVHLGDKIQFTTNNSTEKSFATILAIEPKIDALTRNVMIRAICSKVSNDVFPGAFARIELVAEQKHATLMIPTEAVIPELKGKKVFLYKNGKAVPSKVETGTRNDAHIEILSGVSEGDTIIVTGIMSLKPDAAVNIVEIK